MAPFRLTEKIPIYLQQYIVEQDASLYTPIDHASWRFIMKLSQAFFAKHAHRKYLDGLSETGISTDRIPLISEMDEKLRKFGWRAVAVSGFIPPAVFMEFLSLGILPIACDMRKLENLAYTPAPDIVHEAAGHAPIIADPDYADYLRSYGEISQKAIYSAQDMEVYNAIRELSDIKEDPKSSEQEIATAQKRLDNAVASVDHVSEATQLARMSWWTIEYGLVGEPKDPKIYGAGLLSSVGESYHCLGNEIAKIPFSIDCINMSYDITKPQPQLYLAPDFAMLMRVLKELAERMAFRRGGMEGLNKAIQSKIATTTVLDSGLQITGKLIEVIPDSKGAPAYLRYEGPTQLSYGNSLIEGQGATYHKEGFGCPVGSLKGSSESPTDLDEGELKKGKLEFESGIVLEGNFKSRIQKDGRNVILIYTDCTVRMGDRTLFKPEWGTFDMGCGVRVPSVFGGAADWKSYLEATGGHQQRLGKPKSNLTEENRSLNTLYAKVREARESKKKDADVLKILTEVHDRLENVSPEDWLLRYELLELNSTRKLNAPWEVTIRARLNEIGFKSKVKAELIGRGMELLA